MATFPFEMLADCVDKIGQNWFKFSEALSFSMPVTVYAQGTYN